MNKPEIYEAIDAVSFLKASLFDLGALFTAIKAASDEHTQPYDLAGIGMYLSQDWGDTVNLYFEKLEAMRRAQDGHQE